MTKRVLLWLPLFFFIFTPATRGATVVDTTGIGTATNFDLMTQESVISEAAVGSSAPFATGTLLYYAYRVSETSGAYCYPNMIQIKPDTTLVGMNGLIFPTEDGDLRTGTTTNNDAPIVVGDTFGITCSHGTAPGVYKTEGTAMWDRPLPSNHGVRDLAQMWFYLGTTPFTTSSAPTSPAISFVSPANGSTTGIFNEWELNTANTPPLASCLIRYGLYPDTSAVVDYAPCLIDGFQTVPRTGILWSPPLSIPVHWMAEADLVNSSGAIVASTSEDFYIDPNLSGGGFSSSTPNGTSTVVISCDPNSGFFSNSICNLLVWLFYPTQNSVSQFQNLKTIFGAKPPFGYFSVISSSLSTLQNGTSSLALMDASTSDAFSGIFTPMRTGLIATLWFFFGWWAFHRFRNFDL